MDITSNGANGIQVEDGSVLTVTASGGKANVISNNGADGVRLKGMALAHFLSAATISITGNQGFSLHCDNSSLVEADVLGLSPPIRCSRIAAP